MRHGVTTLTLETEPLAASVSFEAEKLVVELADGRSLTVPSGLVPLGCYTVL